MRILILSLFCMPAFAGNFFIEAGTLYNTDAWGITSNNVGSFAIGYEMELKNLSLELKARHESDLLRKGDQDKVSNLSYGAFVKYKFK